VPLLGQQIGGGEPRGTGPDDHGAVAGTKLGDAA